MLAIILPFFISTPKPSATGFYFLDFLYPHSKGGAKTLYEESVMSRGKDCFVPRTRETSGIHAGFHPYSSKLLLGFFFVFFFQSVAQILFVFHMPTYGKEDSGKWWYTKSSIQKEYSLTIKEYFNHLTPISYFGLTALQYSCLFSFSNLK